MTAPADPNDYWSMDDAEIERLGTLYNLYPYSSLPGVGIYLDRPRVIEGLVKRDATLRAGTFVPPSPPPPAVQNVKFGDLHGTIVQFGGINQATLNFNAAEAKEAVGKIKASVDQLNLTPAAKIEMDADVATAEAQLTSAHPKPSIISECFRSMKSILEPIGTTLATSLASDLAKHIFG